MMTETMALELAPDNIRGNILPSGAIETDVNIELKENKQEFEKGLKSYA